MHLNIYDQKSEKNQQFPSVTSIALLFLICLTVLFSSNIQAGTITLQNWLKPFSNDSTKRTIDYQWHQEPQKNKRICAIIPPSATSYWFAINYGLVKRTRELTSSLKVFHIKENTNFKQQAQLVKECFNFEPDSIVIDETLTQLITQSIRQTNLNPDVISVGKNLAAKAVQASTSTSYFDVGLQLAKYLNKIHKGRAIKRTVLFPGNESEQFVASFIKGFSPNINSNKYAIAHTVHTNNSYVKIKSKLTDYLNDNLDTTTIVGSALVAQAAVEVLDEMSLTNDIQIISYELSAQVFRDIKRGNILASASNFPVTQGQLAIDIAFKLPESESKRIHISPKASIVDEDSVLDFDISYAFAPYGYRETLEVN